MRSSCHEADCQVVLSWRVALVVSGQWCAFLAAPLFLAATQLHNCNRIHKLSSRLPPTISTALHYYLLLRLAHFVDGIAYINLNLIPEDRTEAEPAELCPPPHQNLCSPSSPLFVPFLSESPHHNNFTCSEKWKTNRSFREFVHVCVPFMPSMSFALLCQRLATDFFIHLF